MAKKPSYDDLVTQVTALKFETQRLKEAEDIFHRQNASLKALHETSLGLIEKLDQEELLEKILEHSASLSGTVHGYIYLLQPEKNELQMKVGMGFMKSQVGRKVVLGQGIGGQVWQTASPLVVEDYQAWPGRISDQILNTLRSIVGIPLKYNGRVLGVIGLAHVDHGKQFSAEDITTLEQFAALALLALEKSRLYSDVRRELTERKKAENELARHHDHLEELVAERTRELARTNMKLKKEIEDRRRAEKALRKREMELQAQSQHLAEVNTALRVLLKQRQDDKKELSETVLRNMQDLVTPYLEKVLNGPLINQQRTLLRILEANLNNIVSPFIDRLTSGLAHLTPTEIRVASLVKEGKTNKEIAEILLVSKNTILFHRHNIRDKLGLKNKKINLRSHLLAME